MLVLGGARSGKSTFAEQVATACGEPVLYVATATAVDDEMTRRIARHRAQRPAAWDTLEEPLRIAEQLRNRLAGSRVATLLVEDLTVWLSNLMLDQEATAEARALDGLGAVLRLPAHVVLVSNEVGMGIVPAYPLGRAFRDALGRLNQAAAAACDEVHFLVAGLPLRLK